MACRCLVTLALVAFAGCGAGDGPARPDGGADDQTDFGAAIHGAIEWAAGR